MKRVLKNGSTGEFDPRLEEIQNLLDIYSAVLKGLITRKAMADTDDELNIFSTENIVGEYAEILVCEKLGYIQEAPSNKNFDCTDEKGKKIQIKSRYIGYSKSTGKYEMGGIKEDVLNSIDYVIVLIFKKDFSIEYAFKIPSDKYKDVSYKKNKGVYILSLTEQNAKKINNEHPEWNITQDLR